MNLTSGSFTQALGMQRSLSRGLSGASHHLLLPSQEVTNNCRDWRSPHTGHWGSMNMPWLRHNGHDIGALVQSLLNALHDMLPDYTACSVTA